MTAKDLVPPPSFFRERLWIWATGLAFTALLGAVLAVLTPIGQRALAVWNTPDALDAGFAAQNARMDELSALVAALRRDVQRATGEDRVIRQMPGLSYVAEPVYQGENVVMFTVAERTAKGENCMLTDWWPLFTDETGITMPGERANAGPVTRQISDAPTRLRMEMVPPDVLEPGRVVLYLALTYDCEGVTVYDRTDAVVFQLMAGPRP